MEWVRIVVGAVELEVDPGATRRAYRRIGTPGPEQCGCWYCRNWVAARAHLTPGAVDAFLHSLGVPSNGEIEVYEMPDNERAHLYGGWYLLVGRVVGSAIGAVDPLCIGEFAFTAGAVPTCAVEAFGGLPVVQMSFVVAVDDHIPVEE